MAQHGCLKGICVQVWKMVSNSTSSDSARADSAPRGYARTVATLSGQYRKFFGASVAAVMLLQVTIVTDTIIVGDVEFELWD